MSDPDVWAAFESTPPLVEPVANRDNSLQGFQRRLLEECGEKLGATREDLRIATELLARAYTLLHSLIGNYTIPEGLGDLLVDIDDFRERDHGKNR